MNKGKHPLDDHFRKQLQNYSETSPEESWENIESRIDKKQKRLFFINWRYLTVVVSLLLIGIYYLLENNFFKNTYTDSIENNKDRVQNVSGAESSSPGREENLPTYSKPEKPPIYSPGEKKDGITVIDEREFKGTEKSAENHNQPDIKQGEIDAKLNVEVPFSSSHEKHRINKTSKRFSGIGQDSGGSSAGMDSGYNANTGRMASGTDGLDRTINDVNDTLYFITNDINNLILNPLSQNVKYDKTKKLPQLELSAEAKRWVFSFYYGTVRVNGELETESNNFKNYVDSRNTDEEIQKAISAGISVEYHISPAWYLQSGIRVISVRRTADYHLQRFYLTEEDTTITGYIIDPFNPPQPFSYSYSHTVQKTENFQLQSEFTLTKIRIPALIYFKKYFGKLNINVGAGFIMNLVNLKKGEIVNLDLQALTDFKNENDFLSDNRLDYFFSLQGEYELDDKWSLFLEPAYSNVLIKEKSDVERNEKYMEINLGAKIKF